MIFPELLEPRFQRSPETRVHPGLREPESDGGVLVAGKQRSALQVFRELLVGFAIESITVSVDGGLAFLHHTLPKVVDVGDAVPSNRVVDIVVLQTFETAV
ncbi:hypothetical protein ACFXKG_22465 [Streptomyces sp. NPDC059255]|uniref:hypothetical protein n=1 Tax=Streptomyces sp. NPDC059255 TaxID=3346793 RepID=UPI00367F4B25